MSVARLDHDLPAAHGLLREACAAAHAKLDAKLTRFDLTERVSYAEMLSRMSGPLGALEGALAAGAWPVLFSDWLARSRSDALRADLAALGGAYRDEKLAPIEDEGRAFGALYVLEGSRLGARVLARQVSASGDPAVRAATRFFHHAEDQQHWRSFIVALNGSAAVAARPQRAIDAARDAFRRFDAAF